MRHRQKIHERCHKVRVTEAEEWRDGFLFVGNQPALDLLNTRLVVGEEEQERLSDPVAMTRWLLAAQLLPPSLGRRLSRWSEGNEANEFLGELLAFRESLRSAVFAFEAGKKLPSSFVVDLNGRLSAHPFRIALTHVDGKAHTVQAEGTSTADTLWAALLRETTSLFTQSDAARIRKCETCVVHFDDVSKKNARRWCSMRLCGNRVKVAAYQQRKRLAKD
jgi:predicted RNA-binding Zn ribbon-like protein